MNRNFTTASLRKSPDVRSVLMRMAHDQARAERVRQAKDGAGLTWRAIAEHVGISERAVAEWPKTGSMDADNARKAAEILGVTFDWLWTGKEKRKSANGTPDPFEASERELLERVLEELGAMQTKLDAETVANDELRSQLDAFLSNQERRSKRAK